MNIAIELPEDVAQQLQLQWGDLSQKTLEVMALEAYKSGIITEAEVQRMLKLSSRWEVEAFLKQSQAYLDYTKADLEQDVQAIRQVRQK